MDFNAVITHRYSCRSLSDRPVEQEKLDAILEAAKCAPTAVNRQPFMVFVMESDAAKDAIHQVTKHIFGANTFLVVGAKAEGAWVREFDNQNFADVDASIVATHMMLEIENQGLATTWVGHFDAPKLKALCPQMADYNLIAIFPVGYAADDAAPGHRHAERKATEEIVTAL